MKRGTFTVFLVIIFLFNPIFSPGIETRDEAEKTDDEIRTVVNPNEPLFGEITLDLVEDLKIGKETDDNYLFFEVRDVAVDRLGNIYVADMNNYRIQKFDKNGKYLQTIGRRGQGPGEFDLPDRVRIDDISNKIFVRDYALFMDIFDSNGDFVKTLRFDDPIHDYFPDNEGNLFIIFYESDETGLSHRFCKVDTEGHIIYVIAEYPYTKYYRDLGSSRISVTTGHELSIVFTKLNDRALIYGYSKEYELNIIDHSGKVLLKIIKEEPSPEFTKREKERYKKLGVPKHKPYFYSIFADDCGRIYAQKSIIHRNDDDTHNRVDIFGKDGHFLYKSSLPRNTRVIRNGFLYAYEVNNQDGVEYVKRYKIKNWDQIKSSRCSNSKLG
ncbi:MAG: 6-bladed beta-propeller [Candidatus Aminicenantes bacterium]|nr:6-bladed beta-propeller [Candidatus Aminicenantes bacterium]